ncbi:inactive pancreatic lipase-related protein 1-like isoform X2 [Zootermopsis nevadensis]|uniref:Pancreatic lipase-related protein 1 n=1 Tax=Zootermopsis nevadensis TaxID=136037 RepID=A0A067RMU4_ZOONE|nr:inactive pancreatic lipase-related protein 1-like isoform X2 [Zootermopsis nevadensis]KDR21040.1 Pancreatic lipase-related protein 1 [Zootermopsis nevadensis]
MNSSKYFNFVFCAVLLVQVLVIQSEEESVCYAELGCFSVDEPWSGPLRPVPLPEDPSVIQTRFYLYTRRRPTNRYYVKTWPNIDMKNSYYNGSKETVFIIHGFMSTGNDTWLNDMKNAYLNNVDANVFVVDWGVGASDGEYNKVCANIRVVGAEITRLSRYLIQRERASPIRFHMIGHSLGAHTAGYVAKSIPGVGRITGLDPAQLLFEGFKKEVQLDADDALFVEVVHTDAKPAVPLLGAGILRAVGHVDFYVNGGWSQPGCQIPVISLQKIASRGISFTPVEDIVDSVICPHNRAFEYYTEALAYPNCTFWGRKSGFIKSAVSILSLGWLSRAFNYPSDCSITTCTPLGFRTIDFPARGSFEVATYNSPPYCISEEQVDAKMERELSLYLYNSADVI